MKQLKLLFPILLMLCFSRLLSSCCDANNDVSSENGFYFQFSDFSKVVKIELIGTGRVLDYSDSSGTSAYITLNPADTVSSFRIFYETTTGGEGDGVVTMGYTRVPNFRSNECEEAIEVVYNSHISNTTFSKAVMHNASNFLGRNYVEITP